MLDVTDIAMPFFGQVCAGKSKGKQQMRGGRTAPPQRPEIPTPDVDEANAEFVLFARNTMLPQWVPVTIIKGGSQAKFLADALEHEFGRALYAKVLVRQLATDIWKDKKKLDNQLKRQPNSPMKYANEIQYGFKIRDKSNPKSWHKAEGITLLPNPDTLTPTVVDRVRKFFKRS
eukprot:jgi/Astpho2/7488/Aster-02060